MGRPPNGACNSSKTQAIVKLIYGVDSMVKCKITVVKKTMNEDLAKQYCGKKVGPCEIFKEGDMFITALEKPERFCDWAWNDIHNCVEVMVAGGNFSKGVFKDWMKDDRTIIACCTDGIRPVIFKIERIDD